MSKRLGDLVILFYLFSTFLRFYIGGDFFIFMTLLMVLLGLLLFSYSLIKSIKSLPFLLIIILVLDSIIVATVGLNDIWINIAQLVSNIGFAWAAQSARFNLKLYLWALFIIVFFFVYNIIVGVVPDDVFIVSRNFISIILIMFVAFYILSCHYNDKPPNIYLLFIVFFIVLWGIGRAGIISFAIILFASVFYLSRAQFIIFIVFVFMLIVLFAVGPDEWSDRFLRGVQRFEVMGFESQRSDILSEYLSAIVNDFEAFFWGVSLSDVDSIMEVGGNSHNSYIRLHILSGFVGFVMALALMMLAAYRAFKSGLLIFALFVSVCFRVFFDSAAFHGPMDFIIMYFIIAGLKNIKVARSVSNY